MSKTRGDISASLQLGPRTDLSNSFSKASGVALLLFEGPADLEILFIQRATNPLDNWSGQIAFPGGKKDPADATLLEACIREVQEEIGLTLSKSDLIGSLDDLQARKKGHPLEFYVQPFVFFLSERPRLLACASEVADAFWVPVSHLLDPSNRTQFSLERDHVDVSLPAVRLPRGELLWGLSHSMILNFLKLVTLINHPG